MSDTEYQTLFYTVKYRKEQAMTRLMLDYQCVSGDLETARPWKPYRTAPMYGKTLPCTMQGSVLSDIRLSMLGFVMLRCRSSRP